MVQSRTFEEPRNTTPPGAGGFSRSARSIAAISSSHRPAEGTGTAAGVTAIWLEVADVTATGPDVAGGVGLGDETCFFSSGLAKTLFQSFAIRTTFQPYFSASSSESLEASP